jgi:cation diffusion facilitator CzcD-associated flavoprotein CzcO
MQTTELLVIGAGPFGLAVAAHAKLSRIGVTVVGESMAFWKHSMPSGMLLRSGLEWHLDAAGVHTLEHFLEEKHIRKADVQPIPVEIFREYADWFRASNKIAVQPLRVTRLRKPDAILKPNVKAARRSVRDASSLHRDWLLFLTCRPKFLQAFPPIASPTPPRSWISARLQVSVA